LQWHRLGEIRTGHGKLWIAVVSRRVLSRTPVRRSQAPVFSLVVGVFSITDSRVNHS
jgi:hypothetical protein